MYITQTRNMLNMEAEAKRQEARENMLRVRRQRALCDGAALNKHMYTSQNMQQKREEMQALLAEKDVRVGA
jgi:hypothetical protein